MTKTYDLNVLTAEARAVADQLRALKDRPLTPEARAAMRRGRELLVLAEEALTPMPSVRRDS